MLLAEIFLLLSFDLDREIRNRKQSSAVSLSSASDGGFGSSESGGRPLNGAENDVRGYKREMK